MTTSINTQLSNAASQLLSAFQQQNATISSDTQQAIDEAFEAKGKPLTPSELSKVLVRAMPAKKVAVTKAKKACANSRYHCDGKRGNFLTQLIDFKIVKEQDEVHVPSPPPPVVRDPLFTKFIMDNKAQCTLLFNARDVDENGRPLLMKAIVREGVNVEDLDFSQYRTKWKKTPDIKIVGKKATVVDTKDEQESEFAFGDALLQISLDGEGKELSRGLALDPDNELIRHRYAPKTVGGKVVPDLTKPVTGSPLVDTGHHLDEQPVHTFVDRVRFKMASPEYMGRQWLTAPAAKAGMQVDVEPGLIFEPGSTARVQFLNGSASLAVPKDDAFLVGSKGAKVAVPHVRFQNLNVHQLLAQRLHVSSWSNAEAGDNRETRVTAYAHIFDRAENMELAGRPFKPLQETKLTAKELRKAKIKASLCPVQGNTNGQQVNIELQPGFLKASKGASIKGWKIMAACSVPGGKWTASKILTNRNKTKSGKINFTLGIDDAAKAIKNKAKIEIRIFNENNVPAARFKVPVEELNWA